MEPGKIDLDKELADAARKSDELIAIAMQHGYIPDKTEWLTINSYAKKYNVTPKVVSDWISQGTIPADATMVLEELDNLTVVKDQVYE